MKKNQSFCKEGGVWGVLFLSLIFVCMFLSIDVLHWNASFQRWVDSFAYHDFFLICTSWFKTNFFFFCIFPTFIKPFPEALERIIAFFFIVFFTCNLHLTYLGHFVAAVLPSTREFLSPKGCLFLFQEAVCRDNLKTNYLIMIITFQTCRPWVFVFPAHPSLLSDC